MSRFWRVRWFEGHTEDRIVVADSEKQALDQIYERAKYGVEVRVLDSREEFGWQEEGDGIVSRKG